MTETTHTPDASRPSRLRLVPLAVASALLMEFIDSTALSTALPRLSVVFQTDPVHLKLALTSYLLALAVFAPASGWMADHFGARRVFLIAMTVFLAGSALCAMSATLPQLVAARVVQGIGGAMMTPVGRLIVVSMSPKTALVSSMAWFGTPALIGPLIGPPLSGFILDIADWPWIFLINLPVGMLGMLAVSRLVPPLLQPDPGRFDYTGFALCGVGIVAFAATAETVGLDLVPVWTQVAGAGIAAVALAAYVHHARRREHPVLDITLLRYQSFRMSLIGGTVMRLGLGALPFLLPLLLQTGLGWSPSQAGLVMIATGVGALSSRSLSSWLIHRFGFKIVLVGTGLAAAMLTAVPGLFRESTPIALIVIILAATGFVRSLQFTATNTIAYADVPQNRVGAASTLATVVQQLGMSLGVTTGALTLHLARPEHGNLAPESFLLPFMAIGAISLLAAIVHVTLPRSAGASITGQIQPRAEPVQPRT